MKKFVCLCFAILMSITSVMLAFLWQNNTNKFASAVFSESELKNKVDILNPTQMNSSFQVDAKQNTTLFDQTNEKLMAGSVVVPTASSDTKSVNSVYSISNTTLADNDSIFMWIFIPNEYEYDLSVAFETIDGYSVSWIIESNDLNNMLESSKITEFSYGWRQFEFPVIKANISGEIKANLSQAIFTVLRVSYENDGTLMSIDGVNNNFMFYHIYKADRHSNDVCIVGMQSYVTYKLKESFLDEKIYFVDDEINVSNVQEIFEYLIVGDNNLHQETSNDYSFELSIIDSLNEEYDSAFGTKFVFENSGYHKFVVKVKEYRKNEDNATVLYASKTFNVSNFILGSFTNVDYKVNIDEKKSVTFKLSGYFDAESDIVVAVGDKTLASITYYIKDDICYIKIVGLKEGETKITVKATGKQPGAIESKLYSMSTTLTIENPNTKSASEVFLWVILGVYGVAFVIFLSISLVKARRTGVK